MAFDLKALEAALTRAHRVVRVLVLEHRGSTPREAGTEMFVWADGQSGTIGGGALEYEATDAARAMLTGEQAAVHRQALGPDLGQCCGGAVTLVMEVWDHVPEPEDGVVLRRISGTAPMPLKIKRHLADARGQGQRPPTELCDEWLIEPVDRPCRALWIWGAGHVGRALVDVLAPLPEFTMTWIDTAAARFPDPVPENVTAVPVGKPVDLVPHAPAEAEHLILTYSHELDLALCHALLHHGFSRAGLIGSATKWVRFRKRLKAFGHGVDAIDKIDCPIGDPSLGKHPHQIAIGVAARLLTPRATSAAAWNQRA
ncbi:xanthine dehydrogenase accessory protein XdhC [Thalassococcus sp. S3]|uniref:xanthine dehydrogenase accessory protein XdhC n=1 Tax=Thalassococcus sp. S3 TaxID=2017482 RepID=UPI001024333E|nr:xanthine dehydrogenase accessory protein XdhC [Thalassococcus sp. S3]QBF33068.1 xanthine dehydrogenase accessory protein XdhC [Thalassococcus sp. S3]